MKNKKIDPKIKDKDFVKNIKYINDYIKDLTLVDRIIVANMLHTNSTELYFHGHGVSLRYLDIPKDLLLSIKIFIEHAKKKNEIKW